MNMEKCTGSHNPKWFGLALQALVILSRDNVQTCPSAELALQLQSEPTLLRRILAILARGGILETREGRDGGYRLRKDPHTVSLADVFNALQVADPLCNGMKETTGTHPFGVEMNTIFSEISTEMDKSLQALLGRYTLGELADRTINCESKHEKAGG
ncbi:RrF2 family transcriptional regulator [Paenibacillus sacheonensis]|uniref:Transcriptional regulator n=1 Tax=Paenibacillus sacheonensis TaxID=742054 RepID=A0A7X4YV13_9BACL|nr:Rrf2 family transcriptional regulator [Paenibacillus sacheonensis]MBM7566557.1 Rrf2 family protein [Paenibacillus sacheonensis]NBC73058.1 transcriptional regulator [Paenibacillus sacheonensis]